MQSWERFRDMINNFLVPSLEYVYVDNLWLQQDGATDNLTINLLKEEMIGHIKNHASTKSPFIRSKHLALQIPKS